MTRPRLSGSSDGFFHGILALKKNKFKSRKKKKVKSFSKRFFKIDEGYDLEIDPQGRIK